LIPALRRQRQANLCEFKANLVYRGSSRTAQVIQGNPDSKRKKKKNQREKEKEYSPTEHIHTYL
jgi:hypothetical protein